MLLLSIVHSQMNNNRGTIVVTYEWLLFFKCRPNFLVMLPKAYIGLVCYKHKTISYLNFKSISENFPIFIKFTLFYCKWLKSPRKWLAGATISCFCIVRNLKPFNYLIYIILYFWSGRNIVWFFNETIPQILGVIVHQIDAKSNSNQHKYVYFASNPSIIVYI